MNIENYLQSLDEQKAQEEKQISLVCNPVMDVLCMKFEEFSSKVKDNFSDWTDYHAALKLISGAEYAAEDVKEFSVVLKKYESAKFFEKTSGLFLSALINNSKEEDLEVITEHFYKINYLGYLNEKNLTVIGNLGNNTGNHCAGGRIKILGSTELFTGYSMDGGELIIEGNTGDNAGFCMSGGKLIIKGNAGDNTGWSMRGGEIHISGKYVSIGPDCVGEGKVYCKRKLVWPK